MKTCNFVVPAAYRPVASKTFDKANVIYGWHLIEFVATFRIPARIRIRSPVLCWAFHDALKCLIRTNTHVGTYVAGTSVCRLCSAIVECMELHIIISVHAQWMHSTMNRNCRWSDHLTMLQSYWQCCKVTEPSRQTNQGLSYMTLCILLLNIGQDGNISAPALEFCVRLCV